MKAAIKKIAVHFPSQRLTNADLFKIFPEKADSDVFKKLGIESRPIAAEGECSSDLGVAAAIKLFDTGVISPSDIDFILFCSQTPDYYTPTTACLIQDRLGIPQNCGALDFNLGCSGYVYGLSLAKGLVETGAAKNVLLITAETYSKIINEKDWVVRTVFGDAGAATLISAQDSEQEMIGPFVFGTDGSGGDKLIIPGGGFRTPITRDNVDETWEAKGKVRLLNQVFMNGKGIYNFAVRTVPLAFRELMEKTQRSTEEYQQFIFHQANSFMLASLRDRLRLPEDKFYINMKDCGNTVSCTLPVGLWDCLENGCLTAGDRVLLLGFGVGLSWGATEVVLG